MGYNLIKGMQLVNNPLWPIIQTCLITALHLSKTGYLFA